MSLIRYYMFHSFVNQIKKLLHSWFIIFVICCGLLGGLAGVGAGALVDHQEEQMESVQEADEEAKEAEEANEEVTSIITDFLGEIPSEQIPSLIAAAAILGMLLFFAAKSDSSGSKLFMPADVNLLFTSPLRPQSVLIFRLAAGLGMIVFFVIYFLFVFSVDGSLFNLKKVFYGLAIILTISTALILQSVLYVFGSVHRAFHKRMTYVIYAVLVVLLCGYFGFLRATGTQGQRMVGLNAYLNHKGTNLIPVWGWLKGIAVNANEGNFIGSCLYTVLSLAALVGMVFMLYRQKADFYEEAMHESEKKAILLEKQKDARGGIAFMGKDRSKKKEKKEHKFFALRGAGASVFFFKSMMSRAEESLFPGITKTTLVYFGAALLASVGGGSFFHSDGLLPALIVLGILVFYRSLGNPLSADMRMSYYALIPESPWLKFFYSVLAGTASCVLDLVPAFVYLVIRYHGSLPMILWGALLLISLDLYATITAAFIDVVIPQTVDKMPRQIIQVMFIYFGLVPDAICVVVGVLLEMMNSMLPLALGINLVLACVFFLITPMLLEPKGSAAPRPSLETFLKNGGDLKVCSKVISRIGLSIFIMLIITVGLQFVVAWLVEGYHPEWLEQEWATWVLSFVPQYAIGMPLGIWLLKKLRDKKSSMLGIEEYEQSEDNARSLGIANFLSAFSICVFMMVVGALVGSILTMALNSLFGTNNTAAVQELILEGGMFWKILTIVILAPMFEEYIFRKMIIDNMLVFGDVPAIMTSAAMFGLFHGNFSQMFYAFGIGLVFALVYTKTGRLRYSILLHMIINFCGSILVPLLAADLLTDPLHVTEGAARGFLIYLAIYIILAVIGFVLFCLKVTSLKFETRPRQLPYRKAFETIWLNPGMLLFLAGCVGLVVYSLFG